MTTEYLLEAMGYLDDDLIADADLPVKKSPIPLPDPGRVRRWSSLAACLVLAVSLGWLITHTGMGDKKSESPAPAASAPAASAPAASTPAASIPVGSEGASSDLVGFRAFITVDGLTYAYAHNHPYADPYGPWVDTLPEGCRPVGTVQDLAGDLSIPHTDIGVYGGCALWLEGEGRNSTLYLEHPDGVYLVCEYSQTYDFSPGGTG